jgi:hypothetical protein
MVDSCINLGLRKGPSYLLDKIGDSSATSYEVPYYKTFHVVSIVLIDPPFAFYREKVAYTKT